MYRCKLCRSCSTPGQLLLRHVVRRNDGQIDREIPICEDCAAEIASGKPPWLIADENLPDAGPAAFLAPEPEVPPTVIVVPQPNKRSLFNQPSTSTNKGAK